MLFQRLALALGVALTTFGVVAVVVIQAVRVDPVAGILGVSLGAVFAAGVLLIVFVTIDETTPSVRRDVAAVAGFGYTALFVLGLDYANVAGLDSLITSTVVLSLSALVAVLVWVVLWYRYRQRQVRS